MDSIHTFEQGTVETNTYVFIYSSSTFLNNLNKVIHKPNITVKKQNLDFPNGIQDYLHQTVQEAMKHQSYSPGNNSVSCIKTKFNTIDGLTLVETAEEFF